PVAGLLSDPRCRAGRPRPGRPGGPAERGRPTSRIVRERRGGSGATAAATRRTSRSVARVRKWWRPPQSFSVVEASGGVLRYSLVCGPSTLPRSSVKQKYVNSVARCTAEVQQSQAEQSAHLITCQKPD